MNKNNLKRKSKSKSPGNRRMNHHEPSNSKSVPQNPDIIGLII